ncbi:MAG: hypothetical protein HYR94_02765 [Chloroflexi bacterium]|nr:hypothetical protein [Chloroflexota bacterium]
MTIDSTTGNAIAIGSTGYSDVNALAVAPDGSVYAATGGGALISLNITTGAGSLIGYFGSGLGSSGDLAFRSVGEKNLPEYFSVFVALTGEYTHLCGTKMTF